MNSITDPQVQSSIQGASMNYVENNDIGGFQDNNRVLGRQIPSGNIRGNQTITGSLIINDPTTNTSVMSFSGSNQSIVIGNPTTDPVISISGVDETIAVRDPVNNITRIIIGKLPDNTYGIAISKPGEDVYAAFQS